MEYGIKGLSEKDVEEARKKYGSNTLTTKDAQGFRDKLIENFKDPMIIILVAALGIVIVLAFFGHAEWYEGIGIAAAVILATFVATMSEFKNEQTFQKLQEEASRIKVNVFRDGRGRTIHIDDVVAGDCVLLQPGNKIPADGHVIEGELQVNQAMFTGEAIPERKRPIRQDASAGVALDNPHCVFRGTTVEDGEGVMEVARVGDRTMFGRLAGQLGVEDRKGPLRIKLARLAQDISRLGYICSILIALSFIFKSACIDNGFDPVKMAAYFSDWGHMLYDVTTAAILAVIIIVVAVPEGLPMMIAIVLAQNMRRLLDASVLVRQLMGIETAGSLNILFCDKTGTITKGELTAVNFISPSPGSDSGVATWKDFKKIPEKLQDLLDLSLRYNTSCVLDHSAETGRDFAIGGNITERAMLRSIAYEIRGTDTDDEIIVEKQVLFNSRRKFSAGRLAFPDGSRLTLLKGLPEKIMDNSSFYHDPEGGLHPLTKDLKDRMSEVIDAQSEKGFRIIGIATGEKSLEDDAGLPEGLRLVGFVSLRDDLRPEAKSASNRLKQAGIQVVMLTGDKLGTARAIAKEAGLVTSDKDIVFESEDLNRLSDDELKEILPMLRVVARCLPDDKSRLVKTAQEKGLVAGMTGDGVNDAPALQKSDVGFAMGGGSEVAKEASAIVILDNNIKSIANAVHYGRTIYRSIQKFITFQLTVNLSAILIAFLGPFMGYKLPLTMIQLLWINLIMDTLAALAFSCEPALEKHMLESPKKREEHIINPDMRASILLNGAFITILSIFFLKSGWMKSLFHSPEAFMTGFFAFFVFVNNFNKFNARTAGTDLFAHLFENKGFLKIIGLIFGIQILLTYFGGAMFRTVGLSPIEWIWVTLPAMTVIPVDLTRKYLRDRNQDR